MQYDEVLIKLRTLANSETVRGQSRFAINPENTYGISVPNLQTIAKNIGKDHVLAKKLWLSGIHEARILACMIADPEDIAEKQLEQWVMDFDSWDICDQCCNRLFAKPDLSGRKRLNGAGGRRNLSNVQALF